MSIDNNDKSAAEFLEIEGEADKNEEITMDEDNGEIESNDKQKQQDTINSMKSEFASLSQRVLQLQDQVNSLQTENQKLKSKVFPIKTTLNVDDEKEIKSDEQHTNEYELDLVFLMDCTGSMGSYIENGKESIMNIVEKVKSSDSVDVRFCYIAYRDHPPQDKTFATKVHGFTSNPHDMKKYISLYKAKGGGDGPECVTSALHEAVNLKYRPNAIKICVIIADAPPHGLNQGGKDGFPNGNPMGLDPIKICKQMAKNKIILYVLACEPSLSKYKGAHDLMAGLAKITEGKYLPLTGAHLLPDVIIGGAKEEISLKKLESFIENQMKKLKKQKPNISKELIIEQVTTSVKDMGYTYMNNAVSPVYGNYNNTNILTVCSSASLHDAREQQIHLNQPQPQFNIEQISVSTPELMDHNSTQTVMNRINSSSGNLYY